MTAKQIEAGRRNLVPQNRRTKEEQRRIALQGGKASAEARKARKLVKDALREVLDEPSKKDAALSRLDVLVREVVEALTKRPNAKGLKIIAEILGELDHTVNISGPAPLIVNVKDKDTADALDSLVKHGDDKDI